MKIKATYRSDTHVWTAVKEKHCPAGKKYCTLLVNGDHVQGYVKQATLKAKGLEEIIRTNGYQESEKSRPNKKFKQGKMGGHVERKPTAIAQRVPQELKKRPEK